MQMLVLVLQQVATLFSFILVGFLLRKSKILPEGSDITMARLETYLFLPAMNFFNQLNNCTVDTLKENAKLILWGGVFIAVALVFAYTFAPFFVRRVKGDAKKEYKRSVYRYALTFGNFGFLGNFLVLSIWGSEGLFKYSLFCFLVALVGNSWGLCTLIPKREGTNRMKHVIRGLTSAPTISLVAGCIGGLLGAGGLVPAFLHSALSGASDCMGPVAMVLTGFAIGGYGIKGLVRDKAVYGATAFRLIVIPAVMLTALALLKADEQLMIWTLICFATPMGLNTIIFPAAYGGETKTGASMTFVSHILSIITIPVMYLIFIVWL